MAFLKFLTACFYYKYIIDLSWCPYISWSCKTSLLVLEHFVDFLDKKSLYFISFSYLIAPTTKTMLNKYIGDRHISMLFISKTLKKKGIQYCTIKYEFSSGIFTDAFISLRQFHCVSSLMKNAITIKFCFFKISIKYSYNFLFYFLGVVNYTN